MSTSSLTTITSLSDKLKAHSDHKCTSVETVIEEQCIHVCT